MSVGVWVLFFFFHIYRQYATRSNIPKLRVQSNAAGDIDVIGHFTINTATELLYMEYYWENIAETNKFVMCDILALNDECELENVKLSSAFGALAAGAYTIVADQNMRYFVFIRNLLVKWERLFFPLPDVAIKVSFLQA